MVISYLFFQVKCDNVLKEFGDHLKSLDPLKITRPPESEVTTPADVKKVEVVPAIETAPLTSVSA